MALRRSNEELPPVDDIFEDELAPFLKRVSRTLGRTVRVRNAGGAFAPVPADGDEFSIMVYAAPCAASRNPSKESPSAAADVHQFPRLRAYPNKDCKTVKGLEGASGSSVAQLAADGLFILLDVSSAAMNRVFDGSPSSTALALLVASILDSDGDVVTLRRNVVTRSFGDALSAHYFEHLAADACRQLRIIRGFAPEHAEKGSLVPIHRHDTDPRPLLSTRIAEHRHLITEQFNEEVVDRIVDELRSIENVPGVRGMAMHNNALVLFHAATAMTSSNGNGPPRRLACPMAIRIPQTDRRENPRLHNFLENEHHHPHCQGGTCFGSHEEALSDATNHGDTELVASLVSAFLATYNPNDTWGRYGSRRPAPPLVNRTAGPARLALAEDSGGSPDEAVAPDVRMIEVDPDASDLPIHKFARFARDFYAPRLGRRVRILRPADSGSTDVDHPADDDALEIRIGLHMNGSFDVPGTFSVKRGHPPIARADRRRLDVKFDDDQLAVALGSAWLERLATDAGTAVGPPDDPSARDDRLRQIALAMIDARKDSLSDVPSDIKRLERLLAAHVQSEATFRGMSKTNGVISNGQDVAGAARQSARRLLDGGTAGGENSHEAVPVPDGIKVGDNDLFWDGTNRASLHYHGVPLTGPDGSDRGSIERITIKLMLSDIPYAIQVAGTRHPRIMDNFPGSETILLDPDDHANVIALLKKGDVVAALNFVLDRLSNFRPDDPDAELVDDIVTSSTETEDA